MHEAGNIRNVDSCYGNVIMDPSAMLTELRQATYCCRSSGQEFKYRQTNYVFLTFRGPCIVSTFPECNQQDETFLNLFISVRCSTCFRRFFRPSSGAQNCTYSIRYLSDQYLTLYVQFWAPDDGRKSLKHAERLTEIIVKRRILLAVLWEHN